MSKLPKKVEIPISTFILISSILVSGFLVKKYLFSSSDWRAREQSAAGKQMNLPGINWAEQPKTLILALQTSCHFCNEGAPFYKRLIESVKDKNMKLIAVFPTDIEESKAHLNKLGITNMDVKQASLDSIQVRGTPTLILINNKGEVTNFWRGKLSPDKETEVLEKLISEG